MAANDKLSICLNCGARYATSVPPQSNCPECGGNFYNTPLTFYEKYVIEEVSEDRDFLMAMIKLKEEDIIEFNKKIAPMKIAAEQAKAIRMQQRALEDNRPKCPRCGSVHIQVVPRKWSFWRGFATNKTDRVCVNCNHKW